MKRNPEDVFAVYTENEYGQTVELIVDCFNREYECIYNQDKRYLYSVQNKTANEAHVDKAFFDAIEKALGCNFCGSWVYDGHKKIAEERRRKSEESKKPLITKEKVWQALRWELKETEIAPLISSKYRYEKDDYYDFNLIIGKVHALMKGAKSMYYFGCWCDLLSTCFKGYMKRQSISLDEAFCDLGEFIGTYRTYGLVDTSLVGAEKLKLLREFIAWVKFYNHKICDAKKKTKTDFMTNKVITYVSKGLLLRDCTERLYQVCIVDKKNKTINYLYVPDIDYSEWINYTFVSQAEFDNLEYEYDEDYALDTSIGLDYASVRGW